MSNLQKALEEQKQQTKQSVQQIAGLLGIPLNGQRRVEVSGRNAYVYVRLRSNQSEVIQAYNNKVAPSYNLPVLVERDGNRYVVVSVDTKRYENNWNSQSPFLPRHGNTHSFDTESGGGGDIVWVYPRQITPVLVMPSGSAGAGNVVVNPYILKKNDNSWSYVGNTGTANITQYNPTSPTGAIMVLVYLDEPSGNPYFLVNSGTVFNNSITGSSQVHLYIPQVSNPATQIPLAAIRLITGSNRLSWDNIYDVRQFLHTIPTGSAGGGSVAIQDEGADQGNATTLNFVGDNIQATVSGGVARVFVTGSAGNFVPYTGATADVNLGSKNFSTSGTSNLGRTIIKEGSHLRIGSIIATPTTSFIGFGDGATEDFGSWARIFEKYDDSIAVNVVGETGMVLLVGYDSGHDHLICQFGDIDNVDHGIRLSVVHTGIVISHPQRPNNDVYISPSGTVNIPIGNTYNINGTPHTHSGGGLTYNAVTVTTSNVSVAEDNFYDLTIAGLTADRDFPLPTPSAAGKKVGLRILDGDDTYEIIIKINGVELTREFIAGETLELMSYGTGAGDWKVSHDGRIPCFAEMDRITTNANTTNSAATRTRLDWNNSARDIGNIVDLANDRFLVRRAGYPKVTLQYRPAASVTDQRYMELMLFKNSDGTTFDATTEFGFAVNRVAATGGASLCLIPDRKKLAAAGDFIYGYFSTEEANIGMLRNDAGLEATGGSWISYEEQLLPI